MRRAALIVFHLAAAISLLLCLASIGLWGWGRIATLEAQRVSFVSLHSLSVSLRASPAWTSLQG
jgi:hypothetical protein